jgi:F-type H+-transporting ATPase subunit c
MRGIVVRCFTVLAVLLLAVPVYAQGGAERAASMDAGTWVVITAGFAMAIAAAVCGYSQSKVAAAACEGLARNPGARPGIQLAMLLGLVFIETLALFTFAMIFAKVKVG